MRVAGAKYTTINRRLKTYLRSGPLPAGRGVLFLDVAESAALETWDAVIRTAHRRFCADYFQVTLHAQFTTDVDEGKQIVPSDDAEDCAVFHHEHLIDVRFGEGLHRF